MHVCVDNMLLFLCVFLLLHVCVCVFKFIAYSYTYSHITIIWYEADTIKYDTQCKFLFPETTHL